MGKIFKRLVAVTLKKMNNDSDTKDTIHPYCVSMKYTPPPPPNLPNYPANFKLTTCEVVWTFYTYTYKLKHKYLLVSHDYLTARLKQSLNVLR